MRTGVESYYCNHSSKQLSFELKLVGTCCASHRHWSCCSEDDDVAARIAVVDIWQLELLQSASLDEWIAADCRFKGNEARVRFTGGKSSCTALRVPVETGYIFDYSTQPIFVLICNICLTHVHTHL